MKCDDYSSYSYLYSFYLNSKNNQNSNFSPEICPKKLLNYFLYYGTENEAEKGLFISPAFLTVPNAVILDFVIVWFGMFQLNFTQPC